MTPRPLDWLIALAAVLLFLVVLGLLAQYTAIESDTAANEAMTRRIQETHHD